ncbi:MAG: sialidase family protein [Planctomycetota bacterium]
MHPARAFLLTTAAAAAATTPSLLAQSHDEQPVPPPIFSGPNAAATVPVRPAVNVTRGPFTSIQVNIDAGGANIPNDAANEPSIVVDPTDPDRIVIAWRQFDSITSSFRENGWSYSQDGGQTWTFPGSVQEGQFNSDPVLDADARGRLYYLNYPGGTTIRVWASDDGGQSWSGPTSTRGGDKPWLAVDRTGGIGDGNVYAVWQVGGGPQTFTRSTDGGASFPSLVSIPQSPTFGSLAVDQNGVVFAAGSSGFSSSTFVLARSTNARNPAQTPTFTTATVNLGGSQGLFSPPNPGGLLGQMCVAPDPSRADHIYILCSVNPPGPDPMDVHFVRSVDGGRTFSSPIRVNQDSGNAYQWFGTMSVAPDGRIDAIWNDTRRGSATRCETYYAYSHDTGVTWSRNIPVSPEWNSIIGHPQQNKIGDYYHMVSGAATARLAYSATFNGEQDTYFLELGDCNGNQVHDGLDIAAGTSFDSNRNAVPDECETCQRDLGFGSGPLTLSLCGDDLTTTESRATLDLVGGPASSPVAVILSVGQSVPPIPLAGGALVPDLMSAASTVFSGYSTTPAGRLGVTWGGGANNPTRLYVQAGMLIGGSITLSNALEADIGTP